MVAMRNPSSHPKFFDIHRRVNIRKLTTSKAKTKNAKLDPSFQD
jgi:hypothetical protein